MTKLFKEHPLGWPLDYENLELWYFTPETGWHEYETVDNPVEIVRIIGRLGGYGIGEGFSLIIPAQTFRDKMSIGLNFWAPSAKLAGICWAVDLWGVPNNDRQSAGVALYTGDNPEFMSLAGGVRLDFSQSRLKILTNQAQVDDLKRNPDMRIETEMRKQNALIQFQGVE